ncbi:MAG: NAD(P)H-dependent oxidoreductase [Verrucomicrobiales bacterium]|nr:NAD(P)H-dependent oxidoreductase [Verrucomicrobiales bacterium]
MNEVLLEKLQWRYAAKAFDPAKKISPEDWSTLEEALRLTPSSYGLQPWKFYVITDQELKDELIPASYGQTQVGNCSHLLVFTVTTDLSEADIDKYVETSCSVRGTEPESMEFFRNLIIGDVVTGPRSKDIPGWAKLQSYIALGNFMTCAAMLDIDCCPMEGFVQDAYDEALGLKKKGLTTAVVCPAGYRSDDDKYSALEKVRYSKEDLFEYI